MKKFSLSIFTIFVFISIYAAPTRYKLKNSTSNRNTASAWLPSGIPANGDTIDIPVDKIFTMKTDLKISNAYIDVYGGMQMSGNNMKMILEQNSTILLHTGAWIDGTKASQQIVLNQIIYKGNAGKLSGPVIANSTSNGFIFYQENSLLPVRFVAFDVQKKGKSVRLQWTTEKEENASRFEVERSTDGRHWMPIATVFTQGQSLNHYSFTDSRSVEGTVHYRIREIDLDGKYLFSEIRSLQEIKMVAAQIIASQNTIRLQFGKQLSADAMVQIVRPDGSVAQKINLKAGNAAAQINTSLSGLYIVHISDAKGTVISKTIFL